MSIAEWLFDLLPEELFGARWRRKKRVAGIRRCLRKEQALLVHFNTPMSGHHMGYPTDLQDALRNPHWEMCYSTVQVKDLGPGQLANPADAGACGSVGIIVDVDSATKFIRVNSTDGGSNGRFNLPGLGEVPTADACRRSICNRHDGHNEWFLSGGHPVGIFVFPQPYVFIPGNGELPCTIDQVIADFPNMRIVSSNNRTFIEFDRASAAWRPVSYTEIVPS